MSVRAAGFVTARQKVWLEAIQARINFTAHTLGSMRSVKMLGLSNKFESLIQGMRVTELELSKRFRRLSSFNVCLGKLKLYVDSAQAGTNMNRRSKLALDFLPVLHICDLCNRRQSSG